jgi:hypothetical protein
VDQARYRRYRAALDERIARVGKTRAVYQDNREGILPVDIYVVDIMIANQPRVLLLTAGCGLVDRGNQAPVELAMVLPASWPLDDAALDRPDVFWPFAWLRFVGAHVPKLWWGPLPSDLIRIPADPAHPNVIRFAGVLGAPASWIVEALDEPLAFEERHVLVTALIPLDDRELRWASEHGQDDAGDGSALLELLEERATEVITIDTARASFVPL